MIYYATWKANNGNYPMAELTDTNLKRLSRDVISIANGNRYKGCTCEWYVWDSDLYLIDAGYTLSNGKRFRWSTSVLPDLAKSYGLKYKNK